MFWDSPRLELPVTKESLAEQWAVEYYTSNNDARESGYDRERDLIH